MQPHRRQPTRLPRPWDPPGKNTGVGCHFLLQCRKVKIESEVAQLCLTLSDPMDCRLPGSSVHGIVQARVLEWGAIFFSKNMLVPGKQRPAMINKAEEENFYPDFKRGICLLSKGFKVDDARLVFISPKFRSNTCALTFPGKGIINNRALPPYMKWLGLYFSS